MRTIYIQIDGDNACLKAGKWHSNVALLAKLLNQTRHRLFPGVEAYDAELEWVSAIIKEFDGKIVAIEGKQDRSPPGTIYSNFP